MRPLFNTTLVLAVLVAVLLAIASPAFARKARTAKIDVARVAGNPANGKKLFASSGCGACHTLKAAAAKGTVGPNLDTLKPAYAKIVAQITNGGKVMPAFKSRLKASQIQDVAAFVYASTHK